MLILGIETATPQVGVAIADEQGVLAEFHASGDRRHAETLVPAIKFVSAQAQVAISNLTAVAVDVGPGLFTGLRVGLASAKAIAFACDVPLVGVTSLEVLAFAARFSDRRILATIDARRSEVFYASYRGTADGVVCLEEPQVGEPAAVAEQLAANQPGDVSNDAPTDVLAVGDGALRYRDLFCDVPGLALAPPQMRYPSAAALVELARSRVLRNEYSTPTDLVPQYLRAPDARINWEQRERV